MDLNSIEATIAPLQPHYLTALERLSASNTPLLNAVSAHLLAHKGKQLRPSVTLLTACCCGLPLSADSSHPVFDVAAAIEMLHSSTLLHDDVIDNSDTRRGVPTVNSLWNNKVAVLAGDFYLAQVMKTINAVNNNAVTEIINDAVISMSMGELLQQQHSGDYTIDVDTYLDIIRGKTAVFMAACCNIGALLATDDASLHNEAKLFGLNLGMAFQIRDDIRDMLPSQLTGKPQGNDIRERKCTLPLIYALQSLADDNKEQVLALLQQEQLSTADTNRILDTILATNAVHHATDVMNQYINNAETHLNRLPDNAFRLALHDLSSQLKES